MGFDDCSDDWQQREQPVRDHGGACAHGRMRLKDLDIGDDAIELDGILEEIETRLGRYIPTNADGRATKLHVSQLERFRPPFPR